MPDASNIFDAYVRVSRVGGREGPSFISPEQQRDQIERWAGLRGATIAEWHTDLDQSGAKTDRPGLTAAIERVERGETGGIVVAKVDRFARSLPAALEAIRRIELAGGQTVSVQDGIDPTTTTGKMLRDLLLVFAEWELGRLRDQWRDSRQRAVARGVHVASKTPTGYRKREDGTLEPDPYDAPIVAEAFALKATGGSWQQIRRLLTEKGVTGPYGNVAWTNRAASHVIANRVYLGEARSGEFVNRQAHPPIVARSVFEAAQNTHAGPPVRGTEPSLLAGLLRCAGCRHLLKPDKMTMRDGARVRLYRCRGRHASGDCRDRVAVLGSVIEPWVQERFLNRIGEVQATGHAVDSEALDEAVTALEVAEEELEAFRSDRDTRRTLGRERFNEWLADRVNEVEAARVRLAEVEAEVRPAGAPAFADLAVLWPDLSVEDKQLALRSVIDAVMLRSGRALPIDDRALILWRGEMPGDFPRRGRREPFASFAWPDDAPADVGAATMQDREEHPLEG